MIFMAVREKDRLDLALVLEKVADVRHDHVHAEQFVVGEHHAGVDDDDGALTAERHHMHSKFAETAQRNNVERLIRH